MKPPRGSQTQSRWAAWQLHRLQYTELEELRASPTVWQLEYILTGELKPCGTLIVHVARGIKTSYKCKMCGETVF